MSWAVTRDSPQPREELWLVLPAATTSPLPFAVACASSKLLRRKSGTVTFGAVVVVVEVVEVVVAVVVVGVVEVEVELVGGTVGGVVAGGSVVGGSVVGGITVGPGTPDPCPVEGGKVGVVAEGREVGPVEEVDVVEVEVDDVGVGGVIPLVVGVMGGAGLAVVLLVVVVAGLGAGWVRGLSWLPLVPVGRLKRVLVVASWRVKVVRSVSWGVMRRSCWLSKPVQGVLL